MEWCCIYRREKNEFKWSRWVPLLLARPKERKKDFLKTPKWRWLCNAFCSNGIFKLVLVSGNMDSKQYTDMLTEHFLGDFFHIVGNRAIFQQDNAPVLVSRHSKVFFSDKNVVLMNWPALSLVLNPIENLWGIVERQVYGHGKQYDSKVSLTGAIMK